MASQKSLASASKLLLVFIELPSMWDMKLLIYLDGLYPPYRKTLAKSWSMLLPSSLYGDVSSFMLSCRA